ncbi:MAG: ABC transporter ATP-binding protein [Candidatus Saccharibacteria bacterium]
MQNIIRLFKFSKSLSRYFIAISLFTVLIAILNQLYPLFTKGAIDQITKIIGGGHANVTLVAIFAISIFVSDALSTIISDYSGYLGDMMSIKLDKLMSQRYYDHLLTLPQSYFDSELTGKIINRMSRGINQISNFVQMFTNNTMQFIFSSVFSLVIVAYFSWQVALMLLSIYPIFIFLTTRTSAVWMEYQKKINNNLDIASGRFAETVSQIKVVKSFIQEKREMTFFNNQFDKVIKTTKPQSIYWHKRDAYRRLILNVIFLFIFAYIFIETAHGKYSLGTMVLLIQYAMLIRIPIFSISFIIDSSQRAISNTKDYFEVMDVEPQIEDLQNAKELEVSKGIIQFNGVDFSYDKEKVLSGLSFKLEFNSKTALVGESGEGKTTITSLLMRLYEPSKGTILIDDTDIADVTQHSLRDNIGVVFQEPALFSGTISENIAYARPDATEDDIVSAAKSANAHEFISKFEKSYDSQIGEKGLKLSGGQKQRIAIARAFLKNAPILILDEATSSLDSRSEISVQKALAKLMDDRTTLIIAHRLSTIENVDKIITLKNGTVNEIGSPKELANSGGIYDQLLKLQKGHTEDSKKKLKQFDIAN